jgi:predicted PurR-regulated permease PerM
VSDPATEAEPRPAFATSPEVQRILTMVRWLLYLAFVVIGYTIMRRIAPVLTPVLAAAGIAYLLDPLCDRAEARGISRLVAVALLVVGFTVALGVGIVLLVPLVADELTRFISDLPGLIDSAALWLADSFGYELPESWRDSLSSDQLSGVVSSAAAPVAALASAILGGFFSLLGFLAELLLVPVFTFYFLLDWNRLVVRVKRMIPQRHRGQVTDVASEIDSVVSGWLRGQLTVTLILAVLYAIAFKVIGVHLAIPMGALIGFLTIIPFLGTIVGAIITACLVLLDWQGPGQIIALGGVFLVLHMLEAAVLTPKIVGHRVGLSEVGALFAVLAGGKLLGFTGVLLAVPMAAAIAVLVRRVFRYYEESEFFTDGAVPSWTEGAAEVVGDSEVTEPDAD